jgi:hypothetical protein
VPEAPATPAFAGKYILVRLTMFSALDITFSLGFQPINFISYSII